MYSEKYQWIKGDKAGNVESYASHDQEWIYFLGGGRISVNLLNEYMMQYDGPGFEIEIPKQRTQTVQQTQPVIQEIPVKTIDPVKILLKQSLKTEESFMYTLNLNIPKKTVYELIKDSFDTDVDGLITELVFENIDKDSLYKEIQDNIKEQIINFYKNGTKGKS